MQVQRKSRNVRGMATGNRKRGAVLKPPKSASSERGARRLEWRLIDSLQPYSKNPRTHSEAQVKQIAASIERFGFTNPILLDGENGIIAGHGRLQAAKHLGMKSVPCVDLVGLSKQEQRAYVIADNQLALNAGWDYELLRGEVQAIMEAGEVSVELLGWSESDLKAIMSGFESYDHLTGLDGENDAIGALIKMRCHHDDEANVREALAAFIKTLGIESLELE